MGHRSGSKNLLTHFAHPSPKIYRGSSGMSPMAGESSANQQLNIIIIIITIN